MQHRPTSDRPGIWKRLPLIGRLLVTFWSVILVSSTAAAAIIAFVHTHHTKPIVTSHAATTDARPSSVHLANIAPQQLHMPSASSIVSTPSPKIDVASTTTLHQTLSHPSEKSVASNIQPTTVPQRSLAQPDSTVASNAPSPANPPATPAPTNKSRIAIVLTGFGYSDALTYEVLFRIPSPVAVGVSPYVGNISDVIARARAARREVYVTLPMQSAHPERVDEGVHALGYGNSATDDLHELDWCLARAAGASGLTDASENGDDQPGGGYATSPDFAPIANIISSKGLLYLAGDPQDNRHTRGMTATTWIDGDTDGATLDDQFAALLPHDGQPKNILLMIGPLTPIVIDRLSNWLQSPAAANFTLVAPSVFADDGTATGLGEGTITAQAATLLPLKSVAPL